LITKTITHSDCQYSKNILVLGKEDIESNGLSSREIPEIVEYFTKLPQESVFYLQQTHGTSFHSVEKLTPKPITGDALYTFESSVVLVVKTADCIPLFVWSESMDWVGVIHSGWRGTVAGITEKMVSHIHSDLGILDLQFFMGPCIRQKNYEVGAEVAEHFKGKYSRSLQYKSEEKYLFGNDIALKEKLTFISSGYMVEDTGICNYESGDYYSHRRGDSGRNLNLIWMN
jgi:polyphenol oxidase